MSSNVMHEFTKDLVINGTTNIFGINVPNIYGGFGNGRKTMLAKTIAEIHGVELKEVNQNINRNRKRFIDGVHLIDLKNSVTHSDRLLAAKIMSRQSIANSENIYLLSERGYVRLLKIMDDETAWQKWDIIEEQYFTLAEKAVTLGDFEKLNARCNEIEHRLNTISPIDIQQTKQPVIIVNNRANISEEELQQALLREQACKEILELQEQRIKKKDMKAHIEKWMDKLNITRTHLNRLIAKYKKGGIDALLRPERQDKGERRAVCRAGIHLLKYFYYSKLRISNKEVYQKAKQQAQEYGETYCETCSHRKTCKEEHKGIRLGEYKTASRILTDLSADTTNIKPTAQFKQLSLM